MLVISVFVIIGQSADVLANAVLPMVVETHSKACLNATLQNETGPCCWCHDSTVKCILESNVRMEFVLKSMLKLNYSHMEKMVFMLNNK